MINKFYRLSGKLFGRKLNPEVSMNDAITLCPQQEQEVPPAIFLPEHLQKVTGVTINYDVATMIRRLHQTHLIHAPSKMYALGTTKLFGGGLWTNRNEYIRRLIDEKDHFPHIHLSQAVVTDFDHGYKHFGHWMRDVLPASMVAKPDIPSLSLGNPKYPHAEQYAKLFNLKTIYANKGSIDNLFMLSDYAQNSYKHKRYLMLRGNLKRNLNPKNTNYNGVFVARGKTGTDRTLKNAKELIGHLKAKGFDIIFPETMTSEEIVRRLWNAKVVITVEGSAHNHAIYTMALNGALLTLQPPKRFEIIIKGACDCLGIGWGFYVCTPSNDDEGFYVDSFDDLDRVIYQLQSR